MSPVQGRFRGPRALQVPANSRHLSTNIHAPLHRVCQTPVQGIRASGPRRLARSSSRPSWALSSEIRERPLETRLPLLLAHNGELAIESIKRVGVSANPACPTVPV